MPLDNKGCIEKTKFCNTELSASLKELLKHVLNNGKKHGNMFFNM